MFYLFLMAHLVADFMLQPYWLVKRKQRWSGLCIHGAIVLACMLLLSVLDPSVLQLWPMMLVITAVHVLADRWKVRRADKFPLPPIAPFLLDQLIHIATLSIALDWVLPVARVWRLAASPMALLSLYGSVYITAAFAVPIAVMVWLDPTFRHGALAAGARTRGLLAATAVMSLTLVGGVLIVPATLLGFVVAVRHPVSRHPLDTPTGLFVILVLAGMLTTALMYFCR